MGNYYYLYGASGHAKVILDILKSNNIELNGIIDDFPKSEFLENTVIINKKKYSQKIGDLFLISIGANEIRKKIVCNNTFEYFSVSHISAIISENSIIGKGTVIMPNAIVNSGSKIGDHCIINSGAIVEHDCDLGDFSHISPNATLAGGVKIGEGTHVGIGANIIPNITVGKWAKIGAGAVVVKNVPDYAVVIGVPAKIIKIQNYISF